MIVKKCAAFMCLALALAGSASAAGLDTQKKIPAGAVAVVIVRNIQGDSGISRMLDAWFKSKKQSPLKELLKTLAPQELSVAFLPESKDKPMCAIAVLALPKGASPDKAKLEAVIAGLPGSKVDSLVYKGSTIFFGSGKANSTDFGAYALVQDQLVLGTDADAVKKAIDGPSVDGGANYGKAIGQIAQGRDGLLFADNAGSQFANFLLPREKKWNMDLLLSADALAYVGGSFDAQSFSKLSGTIVFQASKAEGLADVKDDAGFIGEAFKRKFIADKIRYESKVEVKDNTVTLTFQMDGMEPLWTRLFDGGVLDLFAPAP
jgi:hypothetical protein